ncbi:MAG: RidA family protein [Myxococcota bacterium]
MKHADRTRDSRLDATDLRHLHFAPAVRSGDMLYLSGVIGALAEGEEAGDAAYAAGTHRAFKQIEVVLGEAGAKFEDIVSMTSFHVGMGKHLGALAAVKDEYLPEPYPAWTVIGVSELFDPRGFVEIQVIARLPE